MMTRSGRRRKKQSCDDGEGEAQSSENAEGSSATQALPTSRIVKISREEFLRLYTQPDPEEDPSRPSTPAESQADPSSEDEDFSFPKRTEKPTDRNTPSLIGLRNSFMALTDAEEEQENTPALLQPTFKDRLPPIFLKITPSQEHLDIIKTQIYPDTRIQLQGPYLKIVTKDQTEYGRLLGRTRDEQWEYFTYTTPW